MVRNWPFYTSLQAFSVLGRYLAGLLTLDLFSRWLIYLYTNRLKTAKFYCLHEVDPFLKSDYIYGYSLPPCACARSKVIGSVVVVVVIVNTKIA